jgi:O-antigen/teichoic acid export membrane protein
VGSNVGNTLLWLGGGTLLQRVCQLLAMLCVARTLGPERTGVYAQGIALGGVLCALGGAGVRNFVAREIVRAPAHAGALMQAAIRSRLAIGAALTAIAVAVAAGRGGATTFLVLCCLQTVPAAFDLKGLLDAVANARREVVLESSACVLQLALTLLWAANGGDGLAALAAIALLPRIGYAMGALPAMRRLPAGEHIGSWQLLRRCGLPGLSPSLSEVAIVGDVWLCAALAGDAAAGLYAVAQRLAGAASVPSAQLTRLLVPHLHRAAGDGDPARTTRTALRTVGICVLPLAAGGSAAAAGLCGLFGAGFVAAAPALQFALVAVAAQHLAWQGSHSLFALGRERAYAATLWLPTLAHAAGMLLLAPTLGAAGAGLSSALAQTAYFTAVFAVLRRSVRVDLAGALTTPLLLAAGTGAAAFAGLHAANGAASLALALLAGGAAMIAGIWFGELRGRLRRLGAGLVAASRFQGQ